MSKTKKAPEGFEITEETLSDDSVAAPEEETEGEPVSDEEAPVPTKPKAGPKKYFVRFHVSKSGKKAIEKALAMRTSSLCRDDRGKLILPLSLAAEPALIDVGGVDDEEGEALSAICADWLDSFNKQALNALRNGDAPKE
jgi:hypothetical protein